MAALSPGRKSNVLLLAVKRGLGGNFVPQNRKVMIFAEPGFQILQALFIRIHHLGPEAFEQPYVIPVVLDAFAQPVEIFSAPVLARGRQCPPSGTIGLFETRPDRIETLRFQMPFRHALRSL
jgi:hypothetical protein